MRRDGDAVSCDWKWVQADQEAVLVKYCAGTAYCRRTLCLPAVDRSTILFGEAQTMRGATCNEMRGERKPCSRKRIQEDPESGHR